jgi:hypothetical protein
MSVKDSSNDGVVIAFRPRVQVKGCRAGRSARAIPSAMVRLDSTVSLTQLVSGLQAAGLILRWDRRIGALAISSAEVSP